MFKNFITSILTLSLIFLGLACIHFANEVKSLSEAIFSAQAEIAQFGKVVSKANLEVAALRKAIPGYLGEANTVVSSAKSIADDAGSNLLTGIIKSPFKLVKNLGSGLVGIFKGIDRDLTTDDHESIKQAIQLVLKSNQIGQERPWENQKTKRAGVVKLMVIDNHKNCRAVEVSLKQKSKQAKPEILNICKNKKEEWELVK